VGRGAWPAPKTNRKRSSTVRIVSGSAQAMLRFFNVAEREARSDASACFLAAAAISDELCTRASNAGSAPRCFLRVDGVWRVPFYRPGVWY